MSDCREVAKILEDINDALSDFPDNGDTARVKELLTTLLNAFTSVLRELGAGVTDVKVVTDAVNELIESLDWLVDACNEPYWRGSWQLLSLVIQLVCGLDPHVPGNAFTRDTLTRLLGLASKYNSLPLIEWGAPRLGVC